MYTPDDDDDDEVYKNPVNPAGHTVYSTIDQFIAGNAHVKADPDSGPFFNRNAQVELTEYAKQIIEDGKK